MAKQNTNFKKGFTIIEVVLVLAIAGLIFLMVFVALPALQRSQRDTQRRNDYSMLSTAITNYMTNNNGILPKVNATLDASTYINANGTDPNGFAYNIVVTQCSGKGTDAVCAVNTSGADKMTKLTMGSNDNASTVVFVVRNADCTGIDAAGNSVPQYNASSRAFAIYGPLETTTSYCNASQ